MHVMNRFLGRACAVAAAGVALSTVAVTAASASVGGRATNHHGALGIAAGRGGTLRLASNGRAAGVAATANSRYFAGYNAPVRAGSATVSAASFTVPTLSCTTANRAITPVAGVDVNRFKSFSASYVFTGCVNGTALYFPALVVNGAQHYYQMSPFKAGDVIDLTTKVSTNRTRVQVTDVTSGATHKLIKAGARAVEAYMGDSFWTDNNGNLEHVPDFGKLTFKNCLVDGKALASWHPQAVQRVNSHGTVQISTGGFFPGGTAFTTHFMHS